MLSSKKFEIIEPQSSSEANALPLKAIEAATDAKSLLKILARSVAQANSNLIPGFPINYVFNISEITSSHEVHLMPNKQILMWDKSSQFISPQIYDIRLKKIIKTYPQINKDDCKFHVKRIEYIAGETSFFIGHCHDKLPPTKMYLFGPEYGEATSLTHASRYYIGGGLYGSTQIDRVNYFVSCYEDSDIHKNNNSLSKDAWSGIHKIEEPPSCFAVSNFMLIATATKNNPNIRIYRTYKWPWYALLSREWCAHKHSISSLAFVTTSQLASAGNSSLSELDTSICIWNALDGSLLYSLPNIFITTNLLKLPNGWLSSAGSNNIQLWDLQTKEVVLALQSNGEMVLTNDNHLAIVEKDKIKFVDVSSEKRPEKISDEKLIYSSNWKLKLLYFHNILKMDPKKADFSHQNIINSDIDSILELLSDAITLTKLDLSYNNFDEPGLLKLTSIIFSPTSRIIMLNLAGNNLKYYEFSLIANNVRFTDNFTHINLSSNKAELSKNLLLDLLKNFKKNSSLTEIDISNNYTEECSDLMVPHANEQHEVKYHSKNPIYKYSIFKMTAGQTKSMLDPEKNITRTEWIVSMSCNKNKWHSFIHLEGMLENSSVFMRRFDIQPDDNNREATVIVGNQKNMSLFDYRKYALVSFPITRTQGEALELIIEHDRNIKVPFSSINFFEEKINCTKWCIKKLAQINVHVKPNKFDPRPNQYSQSNRKF